MLVICDRRVSIMILFAITLHLWWALMIAMNSAAVNATGIASMYRYIHSSGILAMVLVGASVSSIAALVFNRLPLVTLLLLVPQQILLMMSAAGAVEAVWLQQFADGVLRSREFIAADQAYSVIAAVGYTIAIISLAGRTIR